MASKRPRPAEDWDRDRTIIEKRHEQERDALYKRYQADLRAIQAKHRTELSTHDAAAAVDKAASKEERKRARCRDRVGTPCRVCEQPLVEGYIEACCGVVRCAFDDDDDDLPPALAKLRDAHKKAVARTDARCSRPCRYYDDGNPYYSCRPCPYGHACHYRHDSLDVPYEEDETKRKELSTSIEPWSKCEKCEKKYCEGDKCCFDRCWTCQDLRCTIVCCGLQRTGLLPSCLVCAGVEAENARAQERMDAQWDRYGRMDAQWDTGGYGRRYY